MKLTKRILKWGLGIAVVFAVSFVVVIGPWPVYKDSQYKSAAYYAEAIRAVDDAVGKAGIGSCGGKFSAGWAVKEITPKVGMPMAGYGGRPNGMCSTGVHDPIFVKAVALSDGKDTVVLLGADILLIVPTLRQLTEKKVAEKIPLTSNNILYHASHSHCCPGGLEPGLVARLFFGKYDASLVEFLAERFSAAIIEAYEKLAPARIANGVVDVPDFIQNRSRKAPVDSVVSFCVIQQEAGPKCILTRYSAHPTVYGQDMLEFSGEYPGALQRAVEKETGATAIYLGGAVGSMGPKAPEVPGDPGARVEAMGQGLARKLLEGMGELKYDTAPDVASFSVQFGMPQNQLRPLSPNWRVSPIFVNLVSGIPPVGRMQMAKVGTMVFVGLPFDVSGETAREWRLSAAEKGVNLWVTSFAGAYLGYLSPDKYYNDREPDGNMGYETGTMGWFGPNTEAYVADLFHRGFEKLLPVPASAALRLWPTTNRQSLSAEPSPVLTEAS